MPVVVRGNAATALAEGAICKGLLLALNESFPLPPTNRAGLLIVPIVIRGNATTTLAVGAANENPSGADDFDFHDHCHGFSPHHTRNLAQQIVPQVTGPDYAVVLYPFIRLPLACDSLKLLSLRHRSV